MSGPGPVSALGYCVALLYSYFPAYLASAALAAALRSFSTSAGVSFGGSTEIVSLSILPVNLNGTW